MSVKNIPYTESTTETVEMTELDGMEHGAVLRYMDLEGPDKPCSTREIKTTMGDLLAHCRRRRTRDGDTGMDGLEALVHNRR